MKAQTPSSRQSTSPPDPRLEALEQLVERIAEGQKPARVNLLKQIFKTAFKLGEESPGTLNLKIATTVIKELRYSFKVFYPVRFTPKITVFGSARVPPEDPLYSLARDFGKEASDRGFGIITGGGPGVMAAANEGAKRDTSFGLNIRLPFEQSANSYVDKKKGLIHYKYFFTRKLFLIKEASAFVLFPGGYGTFDETFELLTLLQTGKTPLIPAVFLEPRGFKFWEGVVNFLEKEVMKRGFISPQDRHLYAIAHTPAEAMDHIQSFYRVYHSMRLVGDTLVLRLKKPLPPAVLKKAQKDFGFLSLNGEFQQSGPLTEEGNEPELKDLARLTFPFDRKDFSSLRLLIDFINAQRV